MSLVKSPAFRVFEFEAKLDDTFLDECAKGAIAPLETLNETPLTGWSSPRYLVDGEINADTCRAGKYVHLFVSTAQRRVPASLLAVYCRKTELEMMKEKGVSSLSRATVREIRESVRKQMLKRMPPSISGLEVAIDTDRSIVYTDAKTDKQVDAVSLAFHQAARSALVPLDPAGAALRRFGVQADSLAPAVFTPEDNGDFVVNDLGLDFLTWAVWRHDAGKTEFAGEGGKMVAFSVDGPVSLVLEAQGAHHIALREGAPLASPEFKSALLAGKKVASLRLGFTIGDDTWSGVVSGSTFTFSGVKPPATDSNRAEDATFAERMGRLQTWTDTFLSFFGAFLEIRTDEAAWRKELSAIRGWLPALKVRA